MKNLILSSLLFLTLSLTTAHLSPAFAEGVVDSANEAVKDTGKALTKGARNLKDKTCEMMDGKMKCAGKKLKHKMQNAGDEVNDKVDDLKK